MQMVLSGESYCISVIPPPPPLKSKSWISGGVLPSSLPSSWEIFCFIFLESMKSSTKWLILLKKEILKNYIQKFLSLLLRALHAFNSDPSAPLSECHHPCPLNVIDKETLLNFTMAMFSKPLTAFQMDTTSNWPLVLWAQKVWLLELSHN